MTILISEKVDFRAKKIIRGKEEHYIIIKGTIHQENIIILHVYGESFVGCAHI